tara:strand:- start:1288 stop:2157 length:870 start_codon:yes stop_codon:yes gene_type:complete
MNNLLQNLIYKGKKILSESGVKNAMNEARIIIKRTLKKTDLELIISPNQEISSKQGESILRNYSKRAEGRPVSKIFGFKEFFSNEFIVNKNVLDPRPETELLVELAIKKILKLRERKISLLELGVGSGCLIISILLSTKRNKISALGIDISDKALIIADKNIKKFKLEKRLKLKKSDWFSTVYGKFDIIVSNPPYIRTSDIKNLDKEVRLYDPFIALNGGFKGLRCFEKIARNAKCHLKENGIILLEIGFGQINSVRKIFEEKGFKTFLKEKDLQGIIRVVGFKINKKL